MRPFALVFLVLCQFTAVPFITMVAANTTRPMAPAVPVADTHNVTVIYKSADS